MDQTKGTRTESLSRPEEPRRLSSNVTGPLIQPSRDPDTGLAIFPRLPELDIGATAFEDREPNPPVTVQRSRSLSGRVVHGVRSLWGSSPTSSNTATPLSESASSSSLRKQPVQRTQQLSGGHVYCKHTWDEKCKCLTILTLDKGDYCEGCWEGKCTGDLPPRSISG